MYTAGDKLASSALQDATLESAQKAGMVRFFGPLFVGKYAAKYLNPGPASSYTLTTGAVSQRPIPQWTVIAGYAGGLHSMMRNLALELAPIRVNLISPGAVLTELWDTIPAQDRGFFMKDLEGKMVTGQIGKPEDVAESYLYVMRDQNVTGSVIDTNGGALLK